MLFAIVLHTFISYLCNKLKTLTYILSIYLLLLSVLPCVDGLVCTDDVPTQHSCSHTIDGTTAENATTEDGHEHEAGVCSPFCSCDCCSTSLFDFIQILDYQLIIIPSISYTFLEEPPFQDFSHAVWQPPKLG